MNWKNIIIEWMETEELLPEVLGDPATLEAIAQLSKLLERDLPEEFVSLYSCHDGVGTDINGEADWLFLPIEDLPSLITHRRRVIEETHPSIACRFFPFFDWGNGDSVGYLWDENDRLLPHLYEYLHELHKPKRGQDWEKFLVKSSSSIEEFIYAMRDGSLR